MLSEYFTTSMSIFNPNQERDSGGAVLNTRVANGTVLGHLYSAGASEIDQAIGPQDKERVIGERFYRFLCPSDSAVSEKDILGIATTEFDFGNNDLLGFDHDFKDPTPANNYTFAAANAIHADTFQNRKDVLDFESNTINTYPGIFNNHELSFASGVLVMLRGEFYFPSTNPGVIAPKFQKPDSSYNWVKNEVVDKWVVIEYTFTTTSTVSGYKLTLQFGNNLGTEIIANGEKVFINKFEAGIASVKFDLYDIIGIRERLTGDNAHLETHLKRRI